MAFQVLEAKAITFEDIPVESIALGKLNVGGVWKTISEMKLAIGGVWKTVTEVEQAVGGAWKSLTA